KVRELVNEGYETAKRVLTEHRDELENLAQGLLEYETLTGPEIGRIMRGEPLGRGDDDDEGLTSKTPAIAAIPKTRGRKRSEGDGGMEPEPSA
ncbi:MAG: cell division protein FtsH, partial [Roseinatronobacter sp.]